VRIREVLTEAKARIEHPEDRIFDDGSAGAKAALESLMDAASSSKNISIKFDGTPALIAGNIQGQFVMTDKAGLAKHQFPKTSKEMYSMIFDRKPDQEGRSEYSTSLSGLFQAIQKIIPKTFPGLIQFDVMWFSKPPLVNDVNPTGTTYYQFKPNKVVYNIPSKSELGKQIMSSRYGIVVHSYFETPEDEEPRAISDFHALGLIPSKEVVVLNPKATFEMKPSKDVTKHIASANSLIAKNAKSIDSFLDRGALGARKITDLPALMKKYLAFLAGNGSEGVEGVEKYFTEWIKNGELTDAKKNNILQYIRDNWQGYNAVWAGVRQILFAKNSILKLLNGNSGDIQASINGESSHEGYVVDAPSGKVKIVNRPLFMRK
jgi:hypothetical protein